MDFSDPVIHRNGAVTFGNEKGTIVNIYDEWIPDEEETIKQGKEHKRSVPMIEIRFVGNSKTVVCRPLKEVSDQHSPSDIELYPSAYAKYKNQSVIADSGTPLEDWAILNKGQVVDFKSRNIHTVEHLADLSDAHLKMGDRELRAKAQVWLKSAKDGAGLNVMIEENKSLKSEVEMLREQIKDLASRFASDDEEEPRKRGRPAKSKEE